MTTRTVLTLLLAVTTVSCGSGTMKHPALIVGDEPVVIQAESEPMPKSPEEFSSRCAEIMNAAMDELPVPLDWNNAHSPVKVDHSWHEEYRHGAAVGGLPALAFWIGVTLNTPEERDTFPAQWTTLTGRWRGKEYPADRYFEVDGSLNNTGRPSEPYVHFDADLSDYKSVHYGAVKQRGHCQARIRLGAADDQRKAQRKLGVSVDLKKMAMAFEDIADQCLELCDGMLPAEPVIVDGEIPICQTARFPAAVPEEIEPANLPTLSVSLIKRECVDDRDCDRFPKTFWRPQIEIVETSTGQTVRSSRLPGLADAGWDVGIFGISGTLMLESSIPHSGDFSVRLTWPEKEHAPFEAGFHVDAGDLAVEIKINVESIGISDKRGKTVRYLFELSALPVVRLQRAPDEIKLLRNWTVSASGRPEYIVWNASSAAIYGLSFRGCIHGKIQKWTGSHWVDFNTDQRIGISSCGFGGVEPGEVSRSWQGDFLVAPPVFSPGRYRYSVRYSDEYYDHYRSTKPKTRSVNHFELTDIFEIPESD